MDRPRSGLRQRIFAWSLARFNTRYERLAGEYKRTLLSQLSGTVVEIGPGTGTNLKYLNRDRVRWIGIEPNGWMHSYLRDEAQRLGIAIEIRSLTADSLPLVGNSADAVISTLVLCCVPSQEHVLHEILRVLRPGGQLVFIEHVAAEAHTRLRRIQNFIVPLWKRLGDGCEPNRETWRAIEQAGFEKVKYERITMPIIAIVSPQIVGTATKRRSAIP